MCVCVAAASLLFYFVLFNWPTYLMAAMPVFSVNVLMGTLDAINVSGVCLCVKRHENNIQHIFLVNK